MSWATLVVAGLFKIGWAVRLKFKILGVLLAALPGPEVHYGTVNKRLRREKGRGHDETTSAGASTSA